MKVLIIEDEIKTVQSIRQGLEENGIVVEYAYDGESGLQMIRSRSYDVILSDIIMPGKSGFLLLKEMRAEGISTPVLLLTALDSTDNKVYGLEAGADDYLAKPFEFRELLARIKALARRGREPGRPDRLLVFQDIEIDPDAKICRRAGRDIELTPREFSLLEYFLRHPGRVISKAEISEKVWDLHFDTSTNVVEVYVNYLRNKVDRPFPVPLIHTVFGSGYVLKVKE